MIMKETQLFYLSEGDHDNVGLLDCVAGRLVGEYQQFGET
jgi:hypothetical protein